MLTELVTEPDDETDPVVETEADANAVEETVPDPDSEDETDALIVEDSVIDADGDTEGVADKETMYLGGKQKRGASEIPWKVVKPLRIWTVPQRTRVEPSRGLVLREKK